MALLDSVRTWWQRPPSASERKTIFALGGASPRVTTEYVALYDYLQHRHAGIVVLTFEQMEALLGATLPEAASTDPAWWTGGGKPASWTAAPWTKAGRTATPNLAARTVKFERPV